MRNLFDDCTDKWVGSEDQDNKIYILLNSNGNKVLSLMKNIQDISHG